MEIVFTLHAEERIIKRGISKEEVIEAIKYPENIEKKSGKYYIQKNIGRGIIEIVYEKENYIKVVTVYWLR